VHKKAGRYQGVVGTIHTAASSLYGSDAFILNFKILPWSRGGKLTHLSLQNENEGVQPHLQDDAMPGGMRRHRGVKNRRCKCGKDFDWKGNHAQVCHYHSEYNMIYSQSPLSQRCQGPSDAEHAASGKLDARKRQPLWAAEIKEDDKKKDDAKKLRSLQLTERDVDYIKTPLVYETTGAIGKEAKKWFKKVQLEFRRRDSFGTLGGLGYDHTWSANSFPQWWTQRFAMTTTSQIAACMHYHGGLHPRDRWSCPPCRPAGELIARGNATTQSPRSGRREQARMEGLAPPLGPGDTCALRPRESRLIY
jgi:hypothetical protein